MDRASLLAVLHSGDKWKVPLVMNTHSRSPGWKFPGGRKKSKKESLAFTAAREAREETGFPFNLHSVDNNKYLWRVTFDIRGCGKTEFFCCAMSATSEDLNLVTPHPIQDGNSLLVAKLFDIEDLRQCFPDEGRQNVKQITLPDYNGKRFPFFSDNANILYRYISWLSKKSPKTDH